MRPSSRTILSQVDWSVEGGLSDEEEWLYFASPAPVAARSQNVQWYMQLERFERPGPAGRSRSDGTRWGRWPDGVPPFCDLVRLSS